MGENADIGLEQEIFDDLTAELEISDENFNPGLLLPKVKNAIREFKRVRRYPKYYTEEQIEGDMYDYFANIRNIALYDYNKIGADFEDSHSENSVSRGWSERSKLFAGVIPLSKI